MPQFTAPDGTTKYVPRVYFDTEVRSLLPGPLPEFQIPVIIGRAWEGHPYNADSLVEDGETEPGPFTFVRTATKAAEVYGVNSDIHVAFQWAQRHGLPGAYVMAGNPLTRASVDVDDAANTVQCTLYARSFGAPGGWIGIQFTGGTLTVTPVKNYAFLADDLGATHTRLQFAYEPEWVKVGGTYNLIDQGSTRQSVTVSRVLQEKDSNGQVVWIVEITASTGDTFSTAQNAALYEYDSNNAEIIDSITNAQEFIDFVNDQSSLLGAEKDVSFDGTIPADEASQVPLQELATWQNATNGSSPAFASSDSAAIVTLMNAHGWEDFALRYGLLPQAYLLVSDDSGVHEDFRDYALTERARGYPISVTAGVGWGDTVIDAGDDTDPKFRTNALDSQDFSLWGPGIDGLAPYLSLAPAIFGLRVSGGIGHNLTNDELIFSELETRWDEINSGELTTLLRAGFGTVKLSTGRTVRHRVAQGLSTLQSNAGLIWNETTKDTWSLMQRDLADFIDRVQFVDLEEDIVGADQVDPNVIAATLQRRAQLSLIRRNYLVEYKITLIELNDAANGFNVDQSYRLRPLTDYIGMTSSILIG